LSFSPEFYSTSFAPGCNRFVAALYALGVMHEACQRSAIVISRSYTGTTTQD
jgi:hypothetical protein